MNFLSLNIRGIGAVGKASWVKGMVLQETMLVDSEKFNFSAVWGNEAFGLEFVDAFGKSGGLVNEWNPKKIKKISFVSDQNFIITSGSLIEDGAIINVVNVYAPQKVGEKRALWDRLKGLMQWRIGMSILIGDLN